MPFERFDGHRRGASQSASFYARSAQHLRRYRYPFLAIIAGLSAFTLYQHSYSERHAYQSPSTNLGWQSFLPAYVAWTPDSSPSPSPSDDPASSSLQPGTGGTNGGNDWLSDFDDPQYNDAYDGFAPTQSTEQWDPFTLNPRPLVEITAKSCIWPPSVYDSCMPESSMREDAERGKWLRVEKDLNLRIGVYYLYLFYRRLPYGSFAATIREFKLLTRGEEKYVKLDASDGWQKIGQNLREGIYPSQEPIHLYYRTESRSAGNYSGNEINEIDVLWGSSGTLYGWDRLHRPFAELKEKDARKNNNEAAELMFRKGAPKAPKAPEPLQFSSDGKYKIMQIADLHFSVGKGKCRDSNWPGCRDPIGSDNVTLQWLNAVLDEERPDMVILSGDQLNGQDTSYSSESVILKVAKLFENRKIPWAAVLGNHDSEKTTLTRYGQYVMMQALPYFVGEAGPMKVDGEGNYQLKLYSADESHTHIFSLYFLDSHGFAKASFNPFSSEYDHLKDSQTEWFIEQSNLVKPIERPFTPPTLVNDTFGLIGDGNRSLRRKARRDSKSRISPRQVPSEPSRKKPNAMAIFHIPLPEFYDEAPDMDSKSNTPLVVGNKEEGRGAPKKNSHFFDKAVLTQSELGSIRPDSLNAADFEDDPNYAAAVMNAKPEVKVLLHGHCHVTDQCRRIKGVWMCFAGGSSYSGYGEVGFDRRVRVYQLSDYGETISTYKIVDVHSDASGTSESSYSSSSEKGKQDVKEMSYGQLAGMLEEGLSPGSGQPSEPGRRQEAVSGAQTTHQRIDEMVLVGKGAAP